MAYQNDFGYNFGRLYPNFFEEAIKMEDKIYINDDTKYVQKEFSRFAKDYQHYNAIQKEIAKLLVEQIREDRVSTILDIGSGDGTLYQAIKDKNIDISHYYAMDFSTNMLQLHPSNSNITKIESNFNDISWREQLPIDSIDIVISSSALQWANSFDSLLKDIVGIGGSIYLALFTSNTFKTIHLLANTKSPITSRDEIVKAISNIDKKLHYKSKEYRVYFNSNQELFKYIKHSGISGGKNRLSYKEIKALIKSYPLNYLEFEVIFISDKEFLSI